MAFTINGHCALFHRFQQGRLRLGGRSIDLVGEQNAAENRALAQGEFDGARVEDVAAQHVARHEVGRELHAAELKIQSER